MTPDLGLANGALVADRYRIDAPIARGGMGAVLRATDLRLQRAVALKVLLPALAEDLEAVQRFQREALAAARVQHPSIVNVLDVGTAPHPSGKGRLCYLVMELLEGESLAAISARGPVDPALVLELALQALGALQAAHDAGLVHRDIKPANLVVIASPTGPRVRLVDFGLVQIKTGTVHARLTQTGVIMGTPLYMSPEQARAEPCDARTDVYALGLVAWSCLTGRLPSQATDMAGAIASILTETLPRADRVISRVPSHLGEVIERATQKDPGQRFQSASEFRAALSASSVPARAASASATSTAPPRVETRERSWASIALVGAAGMLLGAAALGVAGLVAGGVYWSRTRGSEPIAAVSIAAEPITEQPITAEPIRAEPSTGEAAAPVVEPPVVEPPASTEPTVSPTEPREPHTHAPREPHVGATTQVAPTVPAVDPPVAAPPAEPPSTLWVPPDISYIPECRTMLTCCRGFSPYAPCNNVYDGIPQSQLPQGCLTIARDFRDRIAAEGRHVDGCDP